MEKEIKYYRNHKHNSSKTLCVILILAFTAIFIFSGNVLPQTQTVGLFLYDSTLSFNGYTLFTPIKYNKTYLIDNNGYWVNKWESTYKPGQSVYFLENGNLLRTARSNTQYFNAGGVGGIVQEFNWNDTIVWQYTYATNYHQQHHDIEMLPNGNTLMIAWERKTYQEAIDAGRNPVYLTDNELWPDHIIEVHPTGVNSGDIVWEWHVWDHLIQDYNPSKPNYGTISDHPELINLNFVGTGPGSGGADWNHTNSIDFNDSLDQIIISVHTFNEIWIIDHSTTTLEAAGHTGGLRGKGGDLLYRWGNPQAYDRGTSVNQKLFKQHDANWIETGYPGVGNILIFNNGQGRPEGNYSSIDEIIPPLNSTGNYTIDSGSYYGPENPTWTYTASPTSSFYAMNISGASRMPNGNTLICNGPYGTFLEVTTSGQLVWKYINPVIGTGPMTQGDTIPGGPMGWDNLVFRIYRYAPDYPGLIGKDLSPKGTIEINSIGIQNLEGEIPDKYNLYQNYPNPFNPTTTIQFSIPENGYVSLKIYNILGKEVATLYKGFLKAGSYSEQFDGSNLSSGVYFYRITAGDYIDTKKMFMIK